MILPNGAKHIWSMQLSFLAWRCSSMICIIEQVRTPKKTQRTAMDARNWRIHKSYRRTLIEDTSKMKQSPCHGLPTSHVQHPRGFCLLSLSLFRSKLAKASLLYDARSLNQQETAIIHLNRCPSSFGTLWIDTESALIDRSRLTLCFSASHAAPVRKSPALLWSFLLLSCSSSPPPWWPIACFLRPTVESTRQFPSRM